MIRKVMILSLLASGTAFSGPAFADDWMKEVAHALAARQTYPATAQMRGEEGTAKVKVYIGADGAVQRAEIGGGSGSTTLDREALAVTARVGHVPAPPAGATSVTVPMTWKLT